MRLEEKQYDFIRFKEEGFSLKDIAQILNISMATARKWNKELLQKPQERILTKEEMKLLKARIDEKIRQDFLEAGLEPPEKLLD